MVIRGYLTGHARREYRDGRRTLCGEDARWFKEHDQFPEPLVTPTTKADKGMKIFLGKKLLKLICV